MKRQYLFLLIGFLLLIGFIWVLNMKKDTQKQPALTVEQLPNKDYNFTMGDQLLEAQLSPEDGGKLVSLKYQEQELLTLAKADSLAYGSTFWPSPHDWGWPPPKEIDRLPYSAKLSENNVLRMEGKAIKKLGLQFIKQFSLQASDTTLRFDYFIVNVSDTNKLVAPWEVTRVPKGGFSFFPVGKDYPAFNNVASGTEGDLYYCDVSDLYDKKAQKLSFDAQHGWLAHVSNGVLLVKQFEDISIEKLAPKAGDVEIYIDNDSDYVELESQGAYIDLSPGDTIAYHTKWHLRAVSLSPNIENLKSLESIVNTLLN